MAGLEGVIIRRARAEDAAGICAAHVASIREVCSRDYTSAQIESWCHGKSTERYVGLIERYRWHVAEAGGRIVGFGEVDPGSDGGAAEVRGLYVAPAHVGRGVGTALMKRLLDEARAAGAVRVLVKGTLTAERFYARCGFVVTGRGSHVTAGGLELPCVEMEMALK